MLELGKTEKRVRSTIIRDYMEKTGIRRAVCFSCGNAYRALLRAGVEVLGIAPNGDFLPLRWFAPSEVRRVFPDRFDATSGHLPIELMTEIGAALRRLVKLQEGQTYRVASGSGETAVCLKLAFPDADIIPVFDNSDPATEWSEHNALNPLLRALFKNIEINNK